MTKSERGRFPAWAERGRAGDLAWIRENLHVFWPAAQQGQEEFGRGAIVVDTTSRPTGEGHPFGYLPMLAFVALTTFAVSRFRLFNIDLVLGKGIVNFGLMVFIFAYFYATVTLFKWLTGESVDARLGLLLFFDVQRCRPD